MLLVQSRGVAARRSWFRNRQAPFPIVLKVVGPEHFGILSIDPAKLRFKMMLCDFFGVVIIEPTNFDQTRGSLQAAIDSVRKAMKDTGLRDMIVAIERTGEYHRPVQRAFRDAGFEVRLGGSGANPSPST